MDSGANGHLKEGGTLSGVKSSPMLCAHSPKIFANRQRGKLALGVLGKRGPLEERGTLITLIVPIFPKWTLGQNGHWGK